ncbi:2-oxo acid dehydrogenase subunit E2 [Luteimonas sp. A501]
MSTSTPTVASSGMDFSEFGEVERIALPRVQQYAAKFLTRNWTSIPHVTHHDEADIGALEQLRKQLSAADEGTRYTPLPFLLKAATQALREFPQFNASLDQDGRHLVFKRYFHIGFAVDTPAGLVVPVIRDVDRKSLRELAEESVALSRQAREKGLSVAQMSGGCFTISSLGSIGGTAFTPIINAPELAILGVSAHQWRPCRPAAGAAESIDWRLHLPLSLSYDHRAINGADAARFIRCLAKLLAHPEALV